VVVGWGCHCCGPLWLCYGTLPLLLLLPVAAAAAAAAAARATLGVRGVRGMRDVLGVRGVRGRACGVEVVVGRPGCNLVPFGT